MPRHRRRPRLSRFILLAGLGALMLSGLGSVVGGTILSQTPAGAAGAVAGAQGGAVAFAAGSAGSAPQPVAARAAAGSPAPASRDRATVDARRHAPMARATPASELTGYQWPLPHGRITLPFGPSDWGSRVVHGELFHDGLDLATFCGDRVVAAHDGVVMAASRHYDRFMGWVGDLEPYIDRLEAKSLWSTLPIVVVIDDGNGYRSMYAHLSKAVVRKGDRVTGGDLIGYEGKTGRASGCHLHYGLFSPIERARFGIDPGVVERMMLPAFEIARIDPMLVLPDRAVDRPRDISAPEPVVSAKPPLE